MMNILHDEVSVSRNSTHVSTTPTPLNHLAFNQDNSTFSVAFQTGFIVFQTDPLKPLLRVNLGAHVGLVAPLYRSKLFCLVGGGGNNPFGGPNKVMIWDGNNRRTIGELSNLSEVKNVKIRRDAIVVVLLRKVIVYKYLELKVLHQFDTTENPKGLCEVSHGWSPMVLVSLALRKGGVRVDVLENSVCKRTKLFIAHDSEVSCMGLTMDGKFLATASGKGTLIRVFNTLNGSLLQEVRRGVDRADIYSLAFSPKAQRLAVSSDKGTVHVFSLKVDSASLGTVGGARSQVISEANQSKLSIFKGLLPNYLNTERSLAQFRLPECLPHFVAFGQPEHTILIISTDGSFYRCQFDPVAGGEMTRLECQNFLAGDALKQ